MTAGDDILACLARRRSIRHFTAEPVPSEIVRRLIEAAGWAPSGGNRQGWEFIVVRSEQVRKQMAESVRAAWRTALAKPDVAGIAETLRAYSANFDWFDKARKRDATSLPP